MARDRITERDLDSLCGEINKLHGTSLKPWAHDEKQGRHVAQIGNWHISHAYGGVNVHRICNESGGITTPLGGGYRTKRELYDRLTAYTAGLQADADRDCGYLQHGQGTDGPFRTERVNVKHQAPDIWHAYFEGAWRKVHVQIRRTYIVYRGERITIQIQGV
jgi:hypothetical protein